MSNSGSLNLKLAGAARAATSISHPQFKDSETTGALYPQFETILILLSLNSSFTPEKPKLPSHFVLATDQTILRPRRPRRGLTVL